MATLKRKRWLILLAMAPLLLTLQSPSYSQDLLHPDDLLEMETNSLAIMEWIDLPRIATPGPSSDALVLVRSKKISTHSHRSPVLAEIYFDSKRYFLKREAAKIIEESATLLEKDGTRKIHIEAFCDKRGTAAYGLALGIHRAFSVARYFQNLEIPSSRIFVSSFGPHQPRCRASSTTCWQESLRIDHTFRLLAMRRPQSGCLTRLRLNLGRTDRSALEHTTRQPFLQRIHLAESH